jgi:FlaA1/EpsC-like NDP-sugar epimerase
LKEPIVVPLNNKQLIGRPNQLFVSDISRFEKDITEKIEGKRLLVYGGAGSIGKEVVKQIFKRNPAALHVIDISENNLVELVRDLRSTLGYIDGETRFLPLDMGGIETAAFLGSQPPYDYVLNLAAMKHVRSEKDEFSLMRMIKTNVIDTAVTLQSAKEMLAEKYFAVSTDKAKNPANLMGATKRIMEDILFSRSGKRECAVSTARFANVAFSDGSLLHGFRQRLLQQQPLSAPRDVRRYFVTGEESGLLCIAATFLGRDHEIFFPNLDAGADLLTFSEIATRFLEMNGYEPIEMDSEDEARDNARRLIEAGKWPCYFFDSDTSGEKPFEEFYSPDDTVDWKRFKDIGVITAHELSTKSLNRAESFIESVLKLRSRGSWTKRELVDLIVNACPELEHVETGKYLDEKM